MSTPEHSFGAHDGSNRDRLRKLLADGQEHDQAEMRRAGGWRYSSRISELRSEGLTIVHRQVGRGAYVYRQLSAPTPRPTNPTWKQRAIAAELRVLELEAILASKPGER